MLIGNFSITHLDLSFPGRAVPLVVQGAGEVPLAPLGEGEALADPFPDLGVEEEEGVVPLDPQEEGEEEEAVLPGVGEVHQEGEEEGAEPSDSYYGK